MPPKRVASDSPGHKANAAAAKGQYADTEKRDAKKFKRGMTAAVAHWTKTGRAHTVYNLGYFQELARTRGGHVTTSAHDPSGWVFIRTDLPGEGLEPATSAATGEQPSPPRHAAFFIGDYLIDFRGDKLTANGAGTGK